MSKIYVGNAPKDLTEQTLKARSEKIRSNRERLLKELSKTKFKYYCGICLIIRDENEYLEEWLKWHICQGAEHFYIYDHGSKQPVKRFVRTLDRSIYRKITVIDWKGKHKDAQPDAYNDCLKRFGTESRWIGFIDADEQVRLKANRTLPEFLKDYEEYAGVWAVWITYNANGHIHKTDGTLRERFTKISRHDEWANKAGKVFVQPLLMREMVIHNGSPEYGFEIADEHKNVVAPYSITNEKASEDSICVDHYYTKSYEEWMRKLYRGCGHAKYQRKYDEFFKVNPDMAYCREEINYKQKYE